MNYLAHLYLADSDDGHRLGNMAGDWVKGKLGNQDLPERVVSGVRRHRAVDRYSDRHPLMVRARARLPDHRRRVSGIILDMLWDHFLVRHWSQYSNPPLEDFLLDCYRSLERMEPHWPERARRALPRIIREDWLSAYGDLDAVAFSLDRIALRFTRDPGLAGSIRDVRAQYPLLEQEFLTFDLLHTPLEQLDQHLHEREDRVSTD
ncbi:MAG: ACP phosphodiesterase, partial [Ectothiorhodospiraceae bacterium]|nr:ACP phosphodiesterase [Ectothiorhodospiraceae bacterium]